MRFNKLFQIFLLLLLIACGPEKNDSAPVPLQYWSEVYVRYLVSDEAYKAELTFLAGDSISTALPTRIEGILKANNRPLKARQLSKDLVRYQLDYQDTFFPEFNLDFQTDAFKRKQLSLPFKPLPRFRVVDQQISISTGGQIILTEAIQLDADENILIMLSDSNKQTASIPIPGPALIDTISLEGQQLTALQKKGTGNIYLLSKKRGSVTDKTVTWNYLLEYYTDEVQLEIRE